MKFDTACIHGYRHKEPTGGLSVPIYMASTYRHPIDPQEYDSYVYSRIQNPTRETAEKTVAALEGGVECYGFSTGMAAIATVMELFDPGDHIIATEDLYGGAIRLFRTILERRGLSFDFVDTGDIVAVKAAIRPNTKGIYLETPTNPMMDITDIKAVKAAVYPDILIIVDNTFLTPYFLNPLELGADIVIHSGTKYLGGHSDTTSGFAVVGDIGLNEKLRQLHVSIGACLSPFDSFLVLRGIKTLAIRMDKAQENAMTLATWLQNHPRITRVLYPGLPSHKGYEIMKRQAYGFGAMISFETDTVQTAHNILKHTKLIAYAESLGCVNSLITIPAMCTHEDLPEEERLARGITDRLLRFSVGIENAKDLIEDLQQAMG
ncbi:MAG: PLP-dependent aspartate aminotransferase family protein [Defluviitaleaceae bacterium]|nr:PLP-dependent aspartate aminotransferase family protein [Defluviitaleaceae bacterium]